MDNDYTLLEMIQSNAKPGEVATIEVIRKLLIEQKMTHFQLLHCFQYNKPLTLLQMVQLYHMLKHLGYSIDNILINDVVGIIDSIKSQYEFKYVMEYDIMHIYYKENF